MHMCFLLSELRRCFPIALVWCRSGQAKEALSPPSGAESGVEGPQGQGAQPTNGVPGGDDADVSRSIEQGASG